MNLMVDKSSTQSGPLMAPLDVLFYAVADSELGKVLVARSAKGVCSILLGDSARELAEDLACRFPRSMLVQNESAVNDDVAKILRYIEKPSAFLNLTLDMRGTPFQRRVWERLRSIPAGRTRSYTDVAHWFSPLANPRAIAQACAANPIALAIPCHRVIRSDGELADYRWGLDRKRTLIRKEAAA